MTSALTCGDARIAGCFLNRLSEVRILSTAPVQNRGFSLFERIRRNHRLEGLSIRGLADRHRVNRCTVRQALASPMPPLTVPGSASWRDCWRPPCSVVWLVTGRRRPSPIARAPPDWPRRTRRRRSGSSPYPRARRRRCVPRRGSGEQRRADREGPRTRGDLAASRLLHRLRGSAEVQRADVVPERYLYGREVVELAWRSRCGSRPTRAPPRLRRSMTERARAPRARGWLGPVLPARRPTRTRRRARDAGERSPRRGFCAVA